MFCCSSNTHMGLESSRSKPIPSDIDSFESQLKEQWHKTHMMDTNNSNQGIYKSLEGRQGEYMSIVGTSVRDFFEANKINDVKILEVMAGNCLSSLAIESVISKYISSWTRTDIGDYSKSSVQMDTIDAVKTYGDESNLLLLVSPPPGTFGPLDGESVAYYGDYFACKKFIETKKDSDKYIIFVGELGASDGSEGMYRYLLEHPRLRLSKRKLMLENQKDFMGGPLELELFIFLIN